MNYQKIFFAILMASLISFDSFSAQVGQTYLEGHLCHKSICDQGDNDEDGFSDILKKMYCPDGKVGQGILKRALGELNQSLDYMSMKKFLGGMKKIVEISVLSKSLNLEDKVRQSYQSDENLSQKYRDRSYLQCSLKEDILKSKKVTRDAECTESKRKELFKFFFLYDDTSEADMVLDDELDEIIKRGKMRVGQYDDMIESIDSDLKNYENKEKFSFNQFEDMKDKEFDLRDTIQGAQNIVDDRFIKLFNKAMNQKESNEALKEELLDVIQNNWILEAIYNQEINDGEYYKDWSNEDFFTVWKKYFAESKGLSSKGLISKEKLGNIYASKIQSIFGDQCRELKFHFREVCKNYSKDYIHDKKFWGQAKDDLLSFYNKNESTKKYNQIKENLEIVKCDCHKDAGKYSKDNKEITYEYSSKPYEGLDRNIDFVSKVLGLYENKKLREKLNNQTGDKIKFDELGYKGERFKNMQGEQSPSTGRSSISSTRNLRRVIEDKNSGKEGSQSHQSSYRGGRANPGNTNNRAASDYGQRLPFSPERPLSPDKLSDQISNLENNRDGGNQGMYTPGRPLSRPDRKKISSDEMSSDLEGKKQSDTSRSEEDISRKNNNNQMKDENRGKVDSEGITGGSSAVLPGKSFSQSLNSSGSNEQSGGSNFAETFRSDQVSLSPLGGGQDFVLGQVDLEVWEAEKLECIKDARKYRLSENKKNLCICLAAKEAASAQAKDLKKFKCDLNSPFIVAAEKSGSKGKKSLVTLVLKKKLPKKASKKDNTKEKRRKKSNERIYKRQRLNDLLKKQGL